MSEAMTVEQARTKRVCRICGEQMPVSNGSRPNGWQTNFGEEVMPERITLNFGREYAHTDCLERPEVVTP